MTVYIASKDKVFSRMLELEVSSYGAVYFEIESGKIPNGGVSLIEASMLSSVILPDDKDNAPIIVYGYKEELENLSFNSYITMIERPFRIPVLISMIFELPGNDSQALKPKTVSDKMYIYDISRQVKIGETSVKLSKYEFNIFKYLYNTKGKFSTRDSINKNVFNSELSSSYEVDVIVCSMRKKFMKAFSKKIIKTKRSLGYYI